MPTAMTQKTNSSLCSERASQGTTQSMLVDFFDICRVVHQFVPQGQTDSAKYCFDVLRRPSHNVWRRRPQLRCDDSWALQPANTPVHSVLETCEFLARNNSHHPPPNYFLDMALYEFSLFPKMRSLGCSRTQVSGLW